MRDYTMLDYQLQNLIPASHDIEDPGFWAKTTAQQRVPAKGRVTKPATA